MFAKIGLINTLQVQILPTVTPVLGLFLMRQYMLDIPDALLDAARIDGAGHLRVYWNIMVPTSAPILGAYAILHFMSVWNAFTWPTLVAQKIAIQPIMVVLPQLVDTTTGMLPTWGTIMAGCVLATLPILIVFILFQDTFMSSVVIGAVKE
jgi:ABC-type glycerol-3-phosphate transport system permease component